jgi:hypothetical protein
MGFYEEVLDWALIILPLSRPVLAPDLLSQGLYRFVKNLKSRIIGFIRTTFYSRELVLFVLTN